MVFYMISVLSGGTGTPKLLQGIKEVYDASKLSVIVNTLENEYFSGVYVSADLDTVLYTLSDLINTETWYGIKGDTFRTHERLNEIGFPEILKIGDLDRATKIQKTYLMKEYGLSKAVDIQRKKFLIESKVLPMSDEQSNIEIHTDEGIMTFHEFLIKNRSSPEVTDIQFNNVEPSNDIISTLEDSEMVIIGPSNPITSIMPIISMKGVEKVLKKSYVVGVSPIVGNTPFSGPASKFMTALNYEASSIGVCSIYKNFLDKFIIDTEDSNLKDDLEKIVSEIIITNTNMKNLDDKIRLAKKVLGE